MPEESVPMFTEVQITRVDRVQFAETGNHLCLIAERKGMSSDSLYLLDIQKARAFISDESNSFEARYVERLLDQIFALGHQSAACLQTSTKYSFGDSPDWYASFISPLSAGQAQGLNGRVSRFIVVEI